MPTTTDALRQIIEGIDKGAVKIDSHWIYDEGEAFSTNSAASSEPPAQWLWHEEWLHHARAALAAEEKSESEAVELIRRLQFGFAHRRCPICTGWNVGPNGETDNVHTVDCPVAVFLAKHAAREG